MGDELIVEETRMPRVVERLPHRRVGNMLQLVVAAREEPLRAAMRLPQFAEHLEHRLAQRNRSFLVALADDVQKHLFRIDGGDRQAGAFAQPQPTGVHRSEASPIDRMANRGDQSAAVFTAACVRQTLLTRLTHFFFVNNAQSRLTVFTKRKRMA
jgi:hypothetical protein